MKHVKKGINYDNESKKNTACQETANFLGWEIMLELLLIFTGPILLIFTGPIFGLREPAHSKENTIETTIVLCFFFLYILHAFLQKPIDVLFELQRLNIRYLPDSSYITKTRLFKYIENFTSKNRKFSDKKLWYFSYFCSKHRLWVLVRTALARRF